ncbi:deleted in azoospermia-like isoform X2 [Stigmatopora argus]
MDNRLSRASNYHSYAFQLGNGYILPEGFVTPHAIFVGGIDTKASASEMKEFFATYGTIKEAKIIMFRGGISKGYGFVYFTEDVDITPIVNQRLFWKGKALKLGPAIIKIRNACSLPTERKAQRLTSAEPWMTLPQYFCFNGYSPNIPCVTQPVPFTSDASASYPVRCSQVPFTSGGSTYYPVREKQPYSHSQYPGFVVPRVPLTQPNPYSYQYFGPYWTPGQYDPQGLMESGIQTIMSV